MIARRCEYLHRAWVFTRPPVNVAVGQCEAETFPGLTVCYEHADKSVLAALARGLVREVSELRKQAPVPRKRAKR